jgi:hypothetical protein
LGSVIDHGKTRESAAADTQLHEPQTW